MTTGCKYLIHAVFSGNRHQFLALYIVRCMKGKCQSHLKFLFRQFINLRYQSAGRYRQVSLADMKSPVFCQNMYEAKEVVIIVQWFPGSHHDYIGYPFPCKYLNPVNLIQHLRRKQASGQSPDGRSTETAAHTTAYLRGNTDRVSMFIAHQNTLDHISVTETEQIFLCSVQLRCLYIHDFQGSDRIFFQFFPQPFGKIGHLVIGSYQMLMQPAIDLLRTERFVSQFCHQFL